MATLNPTQLAERGRKLYDEEFAQKYASGHLGDVLAIDVRSETAYLAKTPLEAVQAARKARPGGSFYLVRIGSPGLYQLRSGRAGASGFLSL